MSNMSYCRFSNTLTDLIDCMYALDEMESLDELSSDEKASLESMEEVMMNMQAEIARLKGTL